MPTNEPRRGRAVILTALPVEYEAVRTHLSNLQEEVHKGTVYERGVFVAGGWQWEVGVVQIGAGNAVAAFEAERAIAYFAPDIVLFVGIAGGIKDVSLGDVVVATRAYGYESGRIEEAEFLARPDVGESSYRLIQRAQAEARKRDWLQRLRGRSRLMASSSPRVLVGPIAAGEKVVASTRSAVFTFLRSAYNDALAVEMEGRGFLKATHANEHVQALIVRGISNLIDNKHRVDAGNFQEVAARHASAFAFEILAKLDVQQSVPNQAQPVAIATKEALRLVDVYVDEDGKTPVLDITLHNAGSQTALPTRAKIEVLDVGEFYHCDEDFDISRSFLPVTGNYYVELTPKLKGKSKIVRIAHELRSNDSDRFQLRIEQNLNDPTLAYVWYYLKITILYNEQAHTVESTPVLLSVPPVDIDVYNVWEPEHTVCAEQNRGTLRRMSALAASRSDSVEGALRFILKV